MSCVIELKIHCTLLQVPGKIDLFVIRDIFHFTDYYFVKAGYKYFPDWNEREESFADYLSRLT